MASATVSPANTPKRGSISGMESAHSVVLREIGNVLNISAKINLNVGFLELGGHSLSAIALVSACKSQNIHLSVENILLSSTIAEILDSAKWIINSSRDPDTSLLPTDSARKRATESTLGPLAKKCHTVFQSNLNPGHSSAGFRSPMTEMQLVFVQGSRGNPGTNIISFYETYQTKDVPAMKEAWKAVLELEAIFRTTFHVTEDEATLVEQMNADFIWEEIVVHNQEDYEKALDENQQPEHVLTSFIVITRPSSGQDAALSTIVWRVHHALIDGFSAALLYKKVRQAAAGLPIKAGTPFTQLAKQLQILQDVNQISCQQFWNKRQDISSNAVGDILLPSPTSSNTLSKNLTKSITVTVPADELTECAQRAKVSPVSIYYAAWAMILSMYNDSDFVVFGVVLAGRDLPLVGVDDSIGPLVNTLPLHVFLDKTLTTVEYMRHIFTKLVRLDSVQYSRADDGFNRGFSSALAAEFEMTVSDGIRPVGQSCFTAVTEVPLSIFIGSNNTLRICYQSHSFYQKDIERLGEHYRNACLGLTATEGSIRSCMENILSDESRLLLRKLGNGLSDSTTASSVHDDLVTIFERAVLADPSAIAIEKASEMLTFAELNNNANQVAKALSQLIEPGDVVCVNADRSINWIIAIYGILKAGGVYSPQDHALPAVAREANFQTAAAKVFLVSSILDKKIKPDSCDVCLAVDELLADSLLSPSDAQIRRIATPSANAYICFTSGSTGKPKGVMCTHEGLVAFQRTPEVRLFAAPGRKISQIMAPAFDGSIHEIFSALSYGATLVLSNSMDLVLHLGSVDSAILTPSLAQKLVPSDFPQLKTLYLVGEPVPQSVNDIWAAQKQVYNMYGPTEGTGGATIQKLEPGKPVTIGVPNPSSRVYILDRYLSLAPPGVIGEIVLAGVQVARGYIGTPDETSNRFRPDHIFGKSGEQMYKTGDRGYWGSTGEVTCIGRRDRQIKLRGFRLDLNDLEIRTAGAVPALTAVAIAQKGDYLVAMVQPATLDIADVRSRISTVLPAYAIPRVITAVDQFPMTPIGKVDYQAVSNETSPATKPALEQSTLSCEEILISAWREALRLGADAVIDGNSNFDDLGGHSLAQLFLASRLTELFARPISFDMIATSVTLRDLARAIDGTGAVAASFEPGLGEYTVSPIEREWWLKYRLNVSSSAFNVALVCALDRNAIDIEKLIEAWNSVLARHRILRCRYVLNHRVGLQRIYSEHAPHVHQAYRVDVENEINRPFKLDCKDPVRVTITDDRLVVVVSHIICDLTTLRILLQEVQKAYDGKTLADITNTYMETRVWNQKASEQSLDFWSRWLEDLPTCSYGLRDIPDRVDYKGSSLLCRVPGITYKNLTNFAASRKVTLHQMALAAVALALQTTSDEVDIMLGGPYLNRPTASDLETVGLFLEPLPFRIRYSPQDATSSSTSYLRSVQESSKRSLSHAVPWTQLLQHLNLEPSFPNHPLLDTMVTFHNNPNALQLSLPGIEPLLTWTEGAKFKLLVEFSAVSNETLLLRLEYDSRIFTLPHIHRIQMLVLEALDVLMTEMPFAEAQARLRRVNDGEAVVAVDRDVAFGTKLSNL